MSFFKKRSVAVIICLLLVLISTSVSVKIKLGAKCDEVTDSFYTGIKYSGETHTSIGDLLRTVTSIGNDMCIIADNYDVNTEDVKNACEWVELAMAYSPDDASYIYYEYNDLSNALKVMEDSLYHKELSERHLGLLNEYSAKLADCYYGIDTAGYNENVRAFLQKYDRYPTNNIARIFGVHFPEYFA